MADIDDVLERLVTDPEFRARLAADPDAALSGYELSPAERELLAAAPDDGRDDLPSGVEQRTSKSALVGLLASFAPGPGITPVPEPAAQPELEEISFTFHRIDMDAADTGDLAAPDDGDDSAILLPAVQKVREAATRFEAPDRALADTPPVVHSEASKVDGFTIEKTSATDAGGTAPPEPEAPLLQPLPESGPDGHDILVVKVTDHNVDAPPLETLAGPSRGGPDILTHDSADAPPPPPDGDFLTVDDA